MKDLDSKNSLKICITINITSTKKHKAIEQLMVGCLQIARKQINLNASDYPYMQKNLTKETFFKITESKHNSI
jgi:hypothetical protein